MLVIGLLLAWSAKRVIGQQAGSDAKSAAGVGKQGAEPATKSHGEPVTRRWVEQRWILDNIIRSVDMEWDQPRSGYLAAPCGGDAGSDTIARRPVSLEVMMCPSNRIW